MFYKEWATFQFSYAIFGSEGDHYSRFKIQKKLSNFKVHELSFNSLIFILSSIEKDHLIFTKLAKHFYLINQKFCASIPRVPKYKSL